ncbi:hypothetical protein SAMN04487859_111115 [Roseovarius lutimaris]|uniref:Uncharacterized protein n=1 Tax=Roseovarius lutimaris TaxID=1005928 RepID=A0A1I5D167_9RHOB|nr:hypothetical protein SAMN04487859_111115 [Roseovarius lutimaris]
MQCPINDLSILSLKGDGALRQINRPDFVLPLQDGGVRFTKI